MDWSGGGEGVQIDHLRPYLFTALKKSSIATGAHPGYDGGVAPSAGVGFDGAADEAPLADEEDDSAEQAMAEFLDWLHVNGVLGIDPATAKLKVVSMPGTAPSEEEMSAAAKEGRRLLKRGRAEFGVYATQNVTKGETLISIPRHMWISDNHTANDLIPYQAASTDVILACWVLRERAKGNASFWAPYIRILPRTFNVPFYFDEDTREQIDYKPMFKKIDDRLSYVDFVFEHASPESIANATKEEIKWALTAVWTRNFGVSFSGDTTPRAEDGSALDGHSNGTQVGADLGVSASMIENVITDGGAGVAEAAATAAEPLQEVLASGGAEIGGGTLTPDGDPEVVMEVDVTATTEETFVTLTLGGQSTAAADTAYLNLSAGSALVEGQEVYDFYGSGDDDRFFMDYGFVPDGNPYNKYELFDSADAIVKHYATRWGGQWVTRVDRSDAFHAVHQSAIAYEAYLGKLDYSWDVPEGGESDGISWPPWDKTTYPVWPESRVEPRLLAAYAAIWLSHSNTIEGLDQEDIDFAQIAMAAHKLGSNLDGQKASCDSLEKALSPNVTVAVRFAAHAVAKKVAEEAYNFKTTYLEDLDLESRASTYTFPCEDSDEDNYNGTSGGQCLHEAEVHLSRQMTLALKYRMAKKKLLLELSQHLQNVCDASPHHFPYSRRN
eukprot:SM000168S02595  [mRNA]  locus=s168:107528:111801:+ [translate_table: standard]